MRFPAAILLALLFVAGPWSAARAAGAVSVALQPEATVAGPGYWLDEVATVTGWTGARVPVGRAPLPGHELRLTALMVKTALVRAGYRAGATITGGPTVIRRATTVIPGADLVAAAEAALRAALSAHARVELQLVTRTPADLVLAAGTYVLQAQPVGAGPYLGHVSVRVAVRQGERTVKTLTFGWQATPWDQVLVCDQRVEAGAELTPAMVHLEERPLDRNCAGALRSPDQLAGRRAGHRILAGSVLTAGAIEPIPTVARGSRVTLTALRDGITITAAGEARDDGFIGDTIRATNLDSGRLVRAKIINDSTLLVR